jgi:hypothetical protein
MGSDYEEWQSVLSAAFLSPHDGPTVLFLDDSEAARLRPDTDDAACDLAEAVRNRLRLGQRRSMFREITTVYRRWQRGLHADPPPVLPVIAITVLAATRMRSDADALSTNYYLRLAQVLMPDADSSAIDSLRTDLAGGDAFLDVVEMWRGLDSWIQMQDGQFGSSTIRDHPHLRRIGYPLSQALVRQSDRTALTRFFHALDFAPGSAPGAAVLLRALDVWTSAAHNRLSESFMHALADTDIRLLLGAVVEAHAQAWDGRVLTPDGKQRIAMLLSLDRDAWQLRWLFPVPPDGPEALTVFSPDGERGVSLSAKRGFDYYVAQDVPAVQAELVFSGVRFRGSEFTAEFSPSPVLFFRPDPQTGAWSSVAGMVPFEEHLVAISSSYVTDFQNVLREAAAEGWRPIPQRGEVLLAGYALFEHVRFADGQALELVLSRMPGLRRIGVAPAVIPRARLVRGLPVAATISATHYLLGGEPDLLLPSGPDPRPATVTLDGLREDLQANGFPLELRRFVHDLGRHIVDADGQELVFTTLEGSPDPAQPPGTATLGWTSEMELSGSQGQLVVTGALVAHYADRPSVLARRGRAESWLLLDGGRAESVLQPASPRFLASIDIEIHSPRFEISPPANARWLAQRRDARWRLTEIGPASPKEYDLDIDVLTAWKRASGDAKGEELWNLQLSLAASAS